MLLKIKLKHKNFVFIFYFWRKHQVKTNKNNSETQNITTKNVTDALNRTKLSKYLCTSLYFPTKKAGIIYKTTNLLIKLLIYSDSKWDGIKILRFLRLMLDNENGTFCVVGTIVAHTSQKRPAKSTTVISFVAKYLIKLLVRW